MANPLALSSAAKVSTETFGVEKQPVLVVDNALGDPDHMVDIAARQNFEPIGPYYPGLRAVVPAAAALQLVQPLAALLVQLFGLTKPPALEESYLSIITTPPEDLTPIQRMPHYDGTEPERMAVLLYLDKAEQGGTAFYRERSTGFESVTEQRLQTYRFALDRGMQLHGLPGPGYCSGDTPLFEQIHTIAGKYNRAIFYRGNTLHCGLLNHGFIPRPDARQGRLTLNLFFSC